MAGQEVLAPLTGPAKFSASMDGEFLFEELFPLRAARVSQADPGEMKELVGENTRTLRRVAAERWMQMNFPATDISAADGLAPMVREAVGPE